MMWFACKVCGVNGNDPSFKHCTIVPHSQFKTRLWFSVVSQRRTDNKGIIILLLVEMSCFVKYHSKYNTYTFLY